MKPYDPLRFARRLGSITLIRLSHRLRHEVAVCSQAGVDYTETP